MLTYALGRPERRLLVFSNGIYVQWDVGDYRRATHAGLVRGLQTAFVIWIRLLPQILKSTLREKLNS